MLAIFTAIMLACTAQTDDTAPDVSGDDSGTPMSFHRSPWHQGIEEADSDTDADADSDTDADSDADTDADSDADSDTDADTDPCPATTGSVSLDYTTLDARSLYSISPLLASITYTARGDVLACSARCRPDADGNRWADAWFGDGNCSTSLADNSLEDMVSGDVALCVEATWPGYAGEIVCEWGTTAGLLILTVDTDG